MDFHGIDSVGKIWVERVSTKPVWATGDDGRIIYANDTQTLSFGVVGAWVDIANNSAGGLGNPAVPIGAIILFESDVALSGYVLASGGYNDDLVYITKGSAAGGEVGGTAKSGGTWTLNTHTHPFNFSSSPHLHKWFTYGGTAAGDSSYDGNGNPSGLGRNNNHGPAQAKLVTAADDDLNGTKDFWTTKTTVSGSGNTNSNLAVDTWRPKGRNWTRQQKT